MSNYNSGDLENAIKALVEDFLVEKFQGNEGKQNNQQTERKEDREEGTHSRGRVAHPESDRRLKGNRAA